MSYLRKPGVASTDPNLEKSPDGGSFQENYPALWEYLAFGVWEDGSVRQKATLLAVYEDGLVKLCLHDRACERVMWVASDCWYDALQACNRALTDGTAEWRRKPPYVPGKPRKG